MDHLVEESHVGGGKNYHSDSLKELVQAVTEFRVLAAASPSLRSVD
jgi:hypothetical protein